MYTFPALCRQTFVSSGQLGRPWKERRLHGEEVGGMRVGAHASVIVTCHTTHTGRGLNAEG